MRTPPDQQPKLSGVNKKGISVNWKQTMLFVPCYFVVMGGLYAGVYWLVYGHLPPWH